MAAGGRSGPREARLFGKAGLPDRYFPAAACCRLGTSGSQRPACRVALAPGLSEFSSLGNKGGHLAPTDKGIGRVPDCSLDGRRGGAHSASGRAASAAAVRHGIEPAAARPARRVVPTGDIPRLWPAGCGRSRKPAHGRLPTDEGPAPNYASPPNYARHRTIHAGAALRQRLTNAGPGRLPAIDCLRTNRLGPHPCRRPHRGCVPHRRRERSRRCPSSSPVRSSPGSGISRFKSATSCRWSNS